MRIPDFLTGLSLLLAAMDFTPTFGVPGNSTHQDSRTLEGTGRWIPQRVPKSNSLRDVFFVNQDSGWIVGQGTILKTIDGGRVWFEPVEVNRWWQCDSVFFLNTRRGFIAASEPNAAILTTTDGGMNWERSFRGAPERILKVIAPNERGWAVGQRGLILTSRDLRSWVLNRVDTSESLLDVASPAIGCVWAVGTKGTILKTVDSGNRWEKCRSGVESDLHGVWAQDGQTVAVVGEGGVILHTTDGGLSWSRQESGVQADLNSMVFVDENAGWIVGAKGTILRTDDRGQTWRAERSAVSSDLNAVFFLNPSRGWIVGETGTLLIYTK